MNIDEFGAAVGYAIRHDLLPAPSTPPPVPNLPFGLEFSSDARSVPIDFIMQHADEWLAALDEEIGPPTSFSLEDVRDWLCLNFGSYRRLPHLLQVIGKMRWNDWLALLGEEWMGFDNISEYHEDLVCAVGACVLDVDSAIPEMMTDEEQTALALLPDHVTIYRGCGTHNKGGYSWTLNREAAIQYAFYERYRAKRPLLLSATIDKSRIAALKINGEHNTVIIFGITRADWRETRLKKADRV